jgi:hypothetical protein
MKDTVLKGLRELLAILADLATLVGFALFLIDLFG